MDHRSRQVLIAALALAESRRAREAAQQAARATEQATKWAGIAAEAQEEANRIAESSMHVRFDAKLHVALHGKDGRLISLGLHDSSDPVWVRDVRPGNAVFQAPWVVRGRETPDAAAMRLPPDADLHLRPGGEQLLLNDPYVDFHEGRDVVWATMTLQIEYSLSEHSSSSYSVKVPVDLSQSCLPHGSFDSHGGTATPSFRHSGLSGLRLALDDRPCTS